MGDTWVQMVLRALNEKHTQNSHRTTWYSLLLATCFLTTQADWRAPACDRASQNYYGLDRCTTCGISRPVAQRVAIGY